MAGIGKHFLDNKDFFFSLGTNDSAPLTVQKIAHLQDNVATRVDYNRQNNDPISSLVFF